MIHLFLIKSRFVIFVCLTGIFVFCFNPYAQADLAPRMFVTELKINEIKGNEIKGEFTAVNDEQYYLSDLNYEIKLFQGTSFNELKLIDVSVPEETFFVPPSPTFIKTISDAPPQNAGANIQEETFSARQSPAATKSFTYAYPKNIISGDYTLRIQIITGRGSELGWKDQKVSLTGENKFLNIFNTFSRVLVGKEESFPLMGVNVFPEDDVVAFLRVNNPGEAITVIPGIKIFKRQLNMPLVQEYQDSPITFAKNETKDISLKMPKLDIPESYLAEVKFYQDSEQVSGIEYFRWVVKGEGGKILYLKADKDYYVAGENMEITIDSIGPADASDIGQGTLKISVSDKNGNLIAETSKDVPLNSDLVSSVISIPVKNDLTSPIIDAKLIKGVNVLDERNISLPLFSQGAKDLEKEILAKKETTRGYLIYFSLAGVFILILAAGFLLYRFKLRRRQ